MYVTYDELIQLGIFIVALIGLVYKIKSDKKQSSRRTCSLMWQSPSEHASMRVRLVANHKK